ncbi:MAG: YdcF family protein [Clostridia bacterium]|nr:YdcF family protein [Clostridia bacterium]
MFLSQLEEKDLNQDMIQKIIFESFENTTEKCDVILVLGSKKAHIYKAPVASQKYIENQGAKIILTGGKKVTEKKEYELMYEALIQEQVKPEDIILEKEAMNTKENFVNILPFLQEHYHMSCKLMLITTAFHMRRSLLTAKTNLPESVQVFPYAAEDQNTKKDNWFLTENGYNRCLLEAKKIITYVKNGFIVDDMI